MMEKCQFPFTNQTATPAAKFGLLRRLTKMDRELQRSERAVVRMQSGSSLDFRTRGPNRPMLASTDPKSFFRFLAHAGIQMGGRLVDLGGGSGRIALPGSLYFKESVMFESDVRLCRAAQKAVRKYDLRNVRIINHNFLWASMRAYDVVFFYKPFLDNYLTKMAALLERTKKGAVIVFRHYSDYEIFDPKHFSAHYPPATDAVTFPEAAMFYSMVRT